MKKYKIDDIKPSEMFLNSLSGYGVGSSSLTCEYCGREHLCPDAEYESEEWKEYCHTEHKGNPDGIILHYDCDSISAHQMNGTLFVIDCRCNGLGKYEQYIWDHKDTIRSYFQVRIEQEAKWAEEQLTLNKLAGI
jgi:hypothetical protein